MKSEDEQFDKLRAIQLELAALRSKLTVIQEQVAEIQQSEKHNCKIKALYANSVYAWK